MAKRYRLGMAATRANLFALAVVTMALPARSQSPRIQVETREDTFSGELLAFDSSEGVQLLGDGSIRLPISEMLNLRFRQPTSGPPAPRGVEGVVTLFDGTRLAYQTYKLEEGALLLELSDRSQGSVRLAGVQRWWLDPKKSPPDTEQRVADVLWVQPRDGEGVTPIEGVVLEVNEQGVRFAFSAEESADPVVAPWTRLAGIDFFREAAGRSTPSCLVTLSGGGRLSADGLRVQDARLEWVSENSRGEIDLGEVRSIDLSAGRVTPVSGLKLLEESWRPYYEVGVSGAGMALDVSFGGDAIRLLEPDPRAPRAWPAVSREIAYETGVALKSRGQVRFALTPNAVRLKGRIGLDPSCIRSGSAEVAVLADQRVVWSGVIDGTTAPVELNAPLEDAATLTLRVDYGDNLDAGDHVHFAELRVIQ